MTEHDAAPRSERWDLPALLTAAMRTRPAASARWAMIYRS